MIKLLAAAATVISCLSFGLARQAAENLPQRIDASGHRLRMRVEGAGSPNVVLETGLAGFLEEFGPVQSKVAEFTRVVAYDRQGSDHDEPRLTGRQVAQELHAALEKAGLLPPYVLVGQSFGGIYNRIFASMYPNEVAGLVLLDPSQETFIEYMKQNYPQHEFSNKTYKNWPEANGVNESLEELKAGGPLPDVPVVVVTAARPSTDPLWRKVQPIWRQSHEDWAKTLLQGRHVVAENSGHGIHVEQPELVVDLIREVVEAARQAQPSTQAQPR